MKTRTKNTKSKRRLGKRLDRVTDDHRYYAKRLSILVKKGKMLSRKEIREFFGISSYDLEIVLDHFSKNYKKEYDTWRKAVLRRGPETQSKKSEDRYANLAQKLINASPKERKEIMKRIKYERLEKLAQERGGIFKKALEVYIDSLPPAQRKKLRRKLEGYTEEMLQSDIRGLVYLLVPIKRIAAILNMKADSVRKRVNKMRGDPVIDRALKLAEGVGMAVYTGKNAAHPRTILELVEILKKNQGQVERKIRNRLSIEPILHKYSDEIVSHLLAIDPKEIKLSEKAKEGLEKTIKTKEKEKLLVFGVHRDKVYETLEEGLAVGKTLQEIANEIAKKYGVKPPSKNAILYHKDIVVRRILAREGAPHYHEILERINRGELDERTLPLAIGLAVYKSYLAEKLHPVAQKEITRLLEKVKKKKRDQPK